MEWNDFPPDFEQDERQESNSSEPLDRFSELPDSVIHFIFSFLPMEYVVRTTILSKRWKDLWTSVPYIYFQAKEGALDEFTNFVNRTLMLWKGKKIQKFTIGFEDVQGPSSCTDLNLWVRFALEHEVEELNLEYFYVNLDTNYWMPQRLFSCSSIRKLHIWDCNMEVSGKIRWDQLKSLTIHNVRWGQVEIDKVLSGSPQLEILTMYGSKNVLSAMEKNDLPSPLLNLKCLSVDAFIGKDVLAGIVNLLEISPDVSILAIEIRGLPSVKVCRESIFGQIEENFKSQIDLPDSFVMRLKTVTITWYADDTSIFSLIEFVLKNASKLEKMVIRAKPIESVTSELLFVIAQKLLRMPRSSPNAEVVLRRWDSEH